MGSGRPPCLLVKRYGDDAMLEATERAGGERLWAAGLL
jgi:hypothetical protein